MVVTTAKTHRQMMNKKYISTHTCDAIYTVLFYVYTLLATLRHDRTMIRYAEIIYMWSLGRLDLKHVIMLRKCR